MNSIFHVQVGMPFYQISIRKKFMKQKLSLRMTSNWYICFSEKYLTIKCCHRFSHLEQHYIVYDFQGNDRYCHLYKQIPTCMLIYCTEECEGSVKSWVRKQHERTKRQKPIHQVFLPLLHCCLLLAMYELLHSLNCITKSSIYLKSVLNWKWITSS